MALLVAMAPWADLQGQPAMELLTRMRRTYQEESSIYLKRHTVLRIERSATGIVAQREVVEEELYLKDQGGSALERQVYYGELMRLKELEAYTLSFQGKGYKRMEVDRFDHKDKRDQAVFHDDVRVASFVLPSVTAGSIAHIGHTIEYVDGRMATGHYFGMHIPTEESSLTVISDPGIDVEVRLFHLADSTLERIETVERGKRVQRLTMRQVPPVEFESNAPSWAYHAPHAQLVIGLAEKGTTADATERLYRWYMEMADSATAGIHPVIQALADSITQGTSVPIERATRIHQWVQEHVRYVAFEDGMNGFVPAAPEEVLRVRYGDCKGMSGLLSSLLRAVGLSAHMTWIGTRDLPYRYAELPSPASTNHMIVALDLPDTTLFLDATSRTCGFGVPSGFIQGKEAMIANGPSRARIVTVPTMPPSFSTMVDSLHAQVDGTALVGHGTARFTGYERYRVAEYLRGTAPHRHTELVRALLMKGSNAFQVDSFAIQGMEDREQALTITYRFRIPGIISSHGSKLFVPSYLSDPWSFIRTTKPRELPIEMDHRSIHRHVMVLTIPEGMGPSAIPPEQRFDPGALTAELRTVLTDGRLISTSEFVIDTLLLDMRSDGIRELNSTLPKALSRTLVLERP